MTAKEFLRQYQDCTNRIRSRLRRIAALKEQAGCITRVLTERVQTSGGNDRQARMIESYVDMQRLLEEEIQQFRQVQLEVCQAIDRLQDSRQRDVLERYYIEGMTLEQVAEDMHYSHKQTCRIHGKGLEQLAGTRRGAPAGMSRFGVVSTPGLE